MALDEHDQAQLAKYRQKLGAAHAEMARWSRYIRSVYEAAGEPTPATEAALLLSMDLLPQYPQDVFVGAPLATAVRMVLQHRERAGLRGPTLAELLETLLGGGYRFGEATREAAVATLKTNLQKNPAFLRTGDYYVLSDAGRDVRRPLEESLVDTREKAITRLQQEMAMREAVARQQILVDEIKKIEEHNRQRAMQRKIAGGEQPAPGAQEKEQ